MVLWDVVQQAQIRGMRAAARLDQSDAALRDARHERRSDSLDERIAQLSVVTEALWDLVSSRLGVGDEELATAVEAVLARRESEAHAPPTSCPTCRAAVGHNQDRCQFCGTTVDHHARSPMELG